MKKNYIKFLTVGLSIVALQTFAQAPKFVLFEHFTQASCGPCAAQNPGFESTILTPNPLIVRHVAFHTSWPGVDPMYNANPTEVDVRVGYYNITGVPTVVMLGNQKVGAPGGMTQADVDAQFSKGSPIKIEVSEIDNTTSRDVTVVIKTLGIVPAGNYKLYTAVVENPINFASAPGNNGELHFPNVFRKMLPSISGEDITIAAIGSSITLNYTYNVDATWQAANVKVVCYVQENTTKEVFNVGTTADPVINYSLSDATTEVANTPAGIATLFNLTSGNTGNVVEDFTYTLTTDAPADWNANFSVGASNFTSTGTLSVGVGATNPVVINVTPGATRGIATYTLTVNSIANPSSPAMLKKVYVISGVTDLIVNNSGFVGDGVTAGNAANWGQKYTDGLVFANNVGYASTNDVILNKAASASALTGVNNVYYNVGWSFPGLTDDNVAALQSFMDAGGNLFIAGQDLAWSIVDATSTYGTPNTQSFFTNYMHATFVADGNTANNSLNTVITDSIFGDNSAYGAVVPNSTVNNFYGGAYFYPDELGVAAGGEILFNYGTGTKIAGIRAQTANYKMVYVAPGMEMLSAANSNSILKRAHDWFYGLTTGFENIDNSSLSIGQNYPNPSTGNTTIALDNIDRNLKFELIDVTGKVVMTSQIIKDSKIININTTNYSAGKYIYRLSDNKGFSLSKAMMIK